MPILVLTGFQFAHYFYSFLHGCQNYMSNIRVDFVTGSGAVVAVGCNFSLVHSLLVVQNFSAPKWRKVMREKSVTRVRANQASDLV